MSHATHPSADPVAAGSRDDAESLHTVTAHLVALLGVLRTTCNADTSAQVSVHVSTTAKGRLQFELRLPYHALDSARALVEGDLVDVIARIRAAASTAGFVLAGDDDA